MAVIICDKALLIISLLVYHSGCFLMLLPVVPAQTENDKSSVSVTPKTGQITINTANRLTVSEANWEYVP